MTCKFNPYQKIKPTAEYQKHPSWSMTRILETKTWTIPSFQLWQRLDAQNPLFSMSCENHDPGPLKSEGARVLTFRSRLSSPSVELTLSYSRVLVGLWRLFFTESWARVFSAFESRRSVSGTASFKSKKRILQSNNKILRLSVTPGDRRQPLQCLVAHK
jgi:hypothetical protein